MTSTTAEPTARERVVGQFRELVEVLSELALAELADGEVLDLARDLEVERRRLDGVDHRLVAEMEVRHLAFDRGCRNTAALLTQLLRIDPGAAKGRVAAAQDLGPRVGLSGEPLAPIFPVVSAAVSAGAISSVHARIVTETIESLPVDVQFARGAEIEQTLVTEATKFTPRDLRLIARRLHETYDQDGVLASDEDRERRRFLDVRMHADGTVSGSFQTDAVTGQALLSALDAGSKPQPADDGTPDPRTARQRRHDALRDLLLLVLRTGELPRSGGVTTTIVLTMTPEQWARAGCGTSQSDASPVGQPRGPTDDPSGPSDHLAAPTDELAASTDELAAPTDELAASTDELAAPTDDLGAPTDEVGGPTDDLGAPTDDLVRTGHGALMNLKQIQPLFGDARVMPVVLSSVRGIEAYGTTHRIFTESQRLAMTARDHGCSFPGCSVPPAWCEAHHVVEFTAGGPTSVDNGALLCGMHHREFERLGYQCTMLNRAPHWTAPAWIDPTQTPTRNTAHTAGTTP